MIAMVRGSWTVLARSPQAATERHFPKQIEERGGAIAETNAAFLPLLSYYRLSPLLVDEIIC
jgi:hypothetical protein